VIPEDILKVATGTAGVVAVLTVGILQVWKSYQAQVAARMVDKDTQMASRMADKDAQITDLRTRLDAASASLREGNVGLELNADATDRLGKTVDKLVRGARVKAP
jgi:hypothetical protein